MNQTRTLLLIAVIFLGWMLFTAWQQDYGPKLPPPPAATASNAATPVVAEPSSAARATAGEQAEPLEGSVPLPTSSASSTGVSGDAEVEAIKQSQPADQGQLVVVETDLLHLVIDSRGATIVESDLKAYPVSLDSDQPVRLLSQDKAHYFVAQSGLVSANGAAPNHRALFTSSANHYSLAEGEKQLQVAFHWRDASGIEVVKTYTFERDSYVIQLEQKLVNHGSTAWTGNAYRQFQRVTPPEPEDQHLFAFSDPSQYSFFGAGWYSPQDNFSKLKFEDFQEEPIRTQASGGWLAMLQHYFFAAWIPPADETDQFASAVVAGDGQPRYLVRTSGPAFQVAPGASGASQVKLYVGPKRASMLEKVAPKLDLAVDYGMLTVIAKPLHWVLSKFHALTGNWGFAIILLLLLIKAIFFKLSEAQYRSMAKMRQLQPKVKSIRERYADDKQKQQQAMMELYKKEKANPLAGCLPMLVQIPVFFALYYMLMQSVELRQAPFILWIQDLSAPDPYFVLPILNGVLMLATQMLTPTTGMDPTQAKMMKFMPVAFAAFFAFFPAGLVLYYCTNALTSLIQMWVIMRRFENNEKKQAA